MLGLLSKARHLRKSLGLGPDGREEFAFDPDSGITLEEQKEIRAEIEKIATGSRISVKPEMFAVKAAKRGVLFPALVNVAAVVVLVLGLAVFYVLFQRGETQLSQEDTGTITAEGKLLAEVKKESEAKLQEKNQQINDIQGRLSQIDKQRQDLQANMDEKVQQKEADLRAAMAAELDAEKARLQKQGLSDQDIQKKLADLEAQKNAAFNKDLDAFKTQADAERKQSEAALKNLQAQYNADLAKANADRQQVLSDSKQREADLQAQLASRTSELQAQAAQTQQELAALSSQKSQEDLVSQQLVGLYSVAQADISARNYTKALSSLQAIGNYINSTDVATLPALAKRRAVDQFIVDSLTQLVQGQINASSIDTSSLVDAANKLSDVRGKVADADAQLKAGKVADAERLYGQALAVLPEVARSYAYFTQKSADAETARQTAVRAALTRAEAAYAAGRFPEMLAAYKEALGALPESSTRLDSLLANVSAAGAAAVGQGAQATQADQSRAAASILSQGDSQLKQGSSADAAATYLQLLQSYPQSTQAPQAIQGVSRSIAAMNAAAAADAKTQAAAITALNSQVASLQASLVDGASEIRGMKKAIMDLLGQAGDPARTDTTQLLASLQAAYGSLTKAAGGSTTLQAQLDAAAKANRDNEAKLAALTDTNRSLQQALQSAQAAQAQAERAARAAQAAQSSQTAQANQAAQAAPAGTVAPLSDADAARLKKFDLLAESYRKYADQEGPPASATTGAPDLRKTYGYRESFLQAASGVFDKLADRMHAYDNGFLSAGIAQGRDDTLKNVAAIVVNLAKVTNAADQKKFFDDQIAAASSDKALADYLRKLQSLMTAR